MRLRKSDFEEELDTLLELRVSKATYCYWDAADEEEYKLELAAFIAKYRPREPFKIAFTGGDQIV
jgi:hypothetical protein